MDAAPALGYPLSGPVQGVSTTDTVTWLHSNYLGSASLVTSASRQVVSNVRYKPYGEVRWQSGTPPTTRKFGRHRSEDGFRLIDIHARYYDPLVEARATLLASALMDSLARSAA